VMSIRGALLLLGIALLQASGKEIFRYKDAETGQAHFMEGEPGSSVNGGWEFAAPEGDSFKMNYAADENGFQPTGDHLPVHVDDTEEVKNAKSQFYAAFEETSNKLEALNKNRVEREADDEEMKEKPAHYAPFYGYFPRQWTPKMKESAEKMQKHQMELKDLHEKYMKTRHETLEKLGKHPYPYFNVYYYPQHLIPDMKLSDEELQKIQADLKEADEKYMKEMQEKVDELKEDFPYYPNFYPPITHFPVNDIDSNKEEETMPKVVPKMYPFHHYSYPPYYTYSHKTMKPDEKTGEDSMEMKSGITPHYFSHFPYHYGYAFPKHAEKEEKMIEKDVAVEDMENSRKKRDVVQPSLYYATYPRIVSQSYYPSNAVYYPSAVSSKINSVSLKTPKVSSGATLRYHPSVAKVTRTVIKLPEPVVDNTVQGAEAVITSDNSEEEPEPEAVPENASEDAEPETVPEAEAEPEQDPVSNDVASNDEKRGVRPVAIQRPIYYPAQGVVQPDIANFRPAGATSPHWGTRMTLLPGTQFYPVASQFYPVSTEVNKKVKTNVKPGQFPFYVKPSSAKLSSPLKEYSTFPVKEKNLNLAAIVA